MSIFSSIGSFFGGLSTLGSAAFAGQQLYKAATDKPPLPLSDSPPSPQPSSGSGIHSYVGPAVSAGLSLLGGLGSQRYASHLERQQAEYSHQAAALAEDKAWQRDTAYNHPTAQVSRLREAGLNPALIYGQSAAGAAGVAHPSVHPRAPSGLSDSVAKYYALQGQFLQNLSSLRQSNYLASQARLTDTKSMVLRHEYDLFRKHGITPSDPGYLRSLSSFLRD